MNKKVHDSVSLAASFEQVVDISEVSGFCVHSIWTGSPTGDIVISASNDNSNFIALDTQATGGTSGQDLFQVDVAHYRYIKVAFVRSSGTGTLTSYVSGKAN